jgi:hypothetical protein
MTPDRDKHVIQQFLGERIVFHESHEESEDAHIEAPEQRPHGRFIALRDQAEERFVRAIPVCRPVTACYWAVDRLYVGHCGGPL